MKIKLLTLSVLTFCASITFAQSTNNEIKESLRLKAKQKHEKMLKSLSNNDFSVEAKKTRGGSRLISFATKIATSSMPPILFEPFDSTHYSYNSNYGYDITPDLFWQDLDVNSLTTSKKHDFDKSDMWLSDGSGNLMPYDSIRCKFTTNHKISNENSHYFAIGFKSHIGYAYDANERRVLEMDTTFMAPDTFSQKYITAYDASNRLNYYEYQEWSNTNPVYIPSFKDSIYYDANNNIIMVKEYEYDNTSGTWSQSGYGDFTFNAANKLTLSIFKIWDGSAYVNDYKSEKLYNTSNQLVSSTNSTYNLGLSSWVPEDKDSFQYASSSYPSMRIFQQYDVSSSSLINMNKYLYTYNTFNQIDEVVTYNWNGGTWENYSNAKYHYEYFNPEAVNETIIEAGTFKVYPSPSNGIIHVAANWNEKQSATINVLDMNGKILMSKPVNSSLNMNETISISTLASGVYLLQIKGEKGILTQKIVRE